MIKPKKVSKYKAKATEYNGVMYHSAKEAGYAAKLDIKKKAGLIVEWERQIAFILSIQDIKICSYILDFKVYHNSGHIEFVDVKGMKSGQAYQTFQIKKRLMKAIHNIEIIEV